MFDTPIPFSLIFVCKVHKSFHFCVYYAFLFRFLFFLRGFYSIFLIFC